MKFTNAVMFSVLFVLNNACMKMEKIKKPDPPSAKAAQLGSNGLSAQPLADIHHYRVSFPKLEAGRQWMVQRIHGSEKNPAALVSGNDGTYDYDIKEAELYEYQWGYLEGAELKIIGSGKIQIPRDLVFEGEVKEIPETYLFPQEIPIGRIEFKKNAKLYTYGQDIFWKPISLVADNATIESFPENKTAAVGHAGRAGGKIEIETDHALGHLHIELRGEHGGEGHAGAAATANMKGAVGRQGTPGIWVATGGSVITDTPPYVSRQTYTCGPKPGNGEKGGLGIQGLSGQDGLAGGDSGGAQIKIKNSQLQISFKRFFGNGGKGGIGGPGGDGGEGGPAGVMPTSAGGIPPNGVAVGACSAFPGPKGDFGPRGPYGQKGAAGTIQQVCYWEKDVWKCE